MIRLSLLAALAVVVVGGTSLAACGRDDDTTSVLDNGLFGQPVAVDLDGERAALARARLVRRIAGQVNVALGVRVGDKAEPCVPHRARRGVRRLHDP